MPARSYRTAITLDGWMYLGLIVILLAAAVIRDINLLMALCGVLVGLGLMNWRSTIISLRELKLTRRAPSAVMAGESFDVEIEIQNPRRSGSSWMLRVSEMLRSADGGPAQSVDVLFDLIRPRTTRHERYQASFNRRGRCQLGPVRITTVFPLGLVRRRMHIDAKSELVVYPRIGTLTPAWLRLYDLADQETRRSQSLQGLVHGDFHSLRDWRSGDSRRLIHWRTSARRGGLMVRQFERHSSQDLLVVVEPWQPQHPTVHDVDRVERAISFAATLCADICRRGSSQITLVVAGNSASTLRGTASTAHLTEMLEALALATSVTKDLLPQALDQALPLASSNARLVVISTRDVQLRDRQRFPDLWTDRRREELLGQSVCLSSGDTMLAELFLEAPPA